MSLDLTKIPDGKKKGRTFKRPITVLLDEELSGYIDEAIEGGKELSATVRDALREYFLSRKTDKAS